MDTKKEMYVKAAIAGTILFVIWMIMRGRATTVPEVPAFLNSFQAPYFTTNPGIPDNYNIVNGGPSFTADNTVNVNTGNISGLSNKYMPLFGLVGMTAVGN